MKVLIIIAHPRTNSLTFSVAERFMEGLQREGHKVEVLDLYREEFNPVLMKNDEPEWWNPRQELSPLVQREGKRLGKKDAVVFIFPLWWYSMPAIMKGYIDRVWSYSFRSKKQKFHHQKILWISLVGEPEALFRENGHDITLTHYLNSGIAAKMGVENSKVSLFFDTLGECRGNFYEIIMDRAFQLGATFSE